MIPKFRAWDKERGMMNVNGFFNNFLIVQLFNNNYSTYMEFVDQIEIMQSTGLKDKNGVEIFEGDVVSVSVRNGFDYLDNKVCIVKNSIDYSGLVCATVDEDLEYQIFNTELFEEYTYEVIGNIYENPELLERS
ncbi:DNA-packaging protein [Enterococcus faecium]|nr:DNA-packaging protein [Enterococcus faecium]